MDETPLHKILLIGDTNTGKTSIVRMFVEGSFSDSHFVTALPTFQKKQYSYPLGNFDLEVWDTAGSEEWTSLNASVYNRTEAIIFVVSIDNTDSLDHITDFWKPKIEEYLDESTYKSFIAVNKIDLSEQEKVLTEACIN